MARPELAKHLRTIVGDLTSLEINTIVTSSILGTKMPSVRHALVEIARDYSQELALRGYPGPQDTPKGGLASFSELRDRANHAIQALHGRAGAHRTNRATSPMLSPEDEENLALFCRIEQKADLLKAMFQSAAKRAAELNLPPEAHDNEYDHAEIETLQTSLDEKFDFPLTPDQLVLVRKIWDLGTAAISLQTVIQLDGDVITRINPRALGSQPDLTRAVHDRMITTSIGTWHELVRLVGGVFSTLAATRRSP